MDLVIDGRSMEVTWPSGVPVTDLTLVLGDTVPVRIRVDHALTGCTPALAVKQAIGSADLIMTVTGWTREDDWQTAGWVVNTLPLQTALGSADRVDLVAELVLVGPDGAQHTSRPIKVRVRRDMLPAEFAPPAEVLADWTELVASALAVQLPAALTAAGMHVDPVTGSSTLSTGPADTWTPVSLYAITWGDELLAGNLTDSCRLRQVTMTLLGAAQSPDPYWLSILRGCDGTYERIGISAPVDVPVTGQPVTWDFTPGVSLRRGDKIMLEICAGADAGNAVRTPLDLHVVNTPVKDGRGICTSDGYPAVITDGTMAPMMTVMVDYDDGVSVGGTQLATVTQVQGLGSDVRTASSNAQASATDAATARAQAQEALRLANEARDAAQQALAAIPQVDAEGNMTLTGSLTAPTATINGVIKVINTGTGVADINYIYGVTWLADQVELRRGGIVRDDVWVETGVIRIGSRAALSATGPVYLSAVSADQCINANGGINIPLPPVRSGDAVNLGNLPMMEFAPTQQIHVTKSAWEIRGTCNDTAQGLAFNFLNPGEFVGACARVMQWSDSQSYSTIMTTVILTDWFGGNVLVDLAYSNNNISITPISSSDTPFLEQAIQLSIFESRDGDVITGRIINSDGEATSFSAPYKFSHSCVIRIFLLETGSMLRVYLGRFTSGMVDGEETALTLPLLLGEVPIKTGIKRACWLGIGGIRSSEPSDTTGRLPAINSVNRYYGKWLNNLFNNQS